MKRRVTKRIAVLIALVHQSGSFQETAKGESTSEA